MSSAARLVIGIPTYRRPELLDRLLDTLGEQARAAGALVVVGDNAPTGPGVDPAPEGLPGPSAGVLEVVARHAGAGLEVGCVPVHEPGVAEVRNVLVREATLRRPDWTHLVMLDDDGLVTPGWLEALLDAALTHDADVAAGPVLGDVPPGTGLLGRNSFLAARPTHATGPVAMLNGAQNIVIARRLADRLDDPWFLPELGRSGSEDYQFFRRVRVAGARLVWADTAVVLEPPPADRLRAGPLLRRAFHANRVNGAIDRGFDGAGTAARGVLRGYGALGRSFAAAAVRRDPDRFAKGLIDAVSLAGRTTGILRPPDTAGAGRYGAPVTPEAAPPPSRPRRSAPE